MLSPHDRRTFLSGLAAAGAVAGLGDLSFPAGLPRVSAAELAPLPDVVPLRTEIEPLVRLLEDTPRSRLIEDVAGRVRQGLTYRELLAALLLAGVRNVQPRPSVGFKFHAVLVVNSVHLAALASPETERWLPLFWALDYFKDSQARDELEDFASVSTAWRGRFLAACTMLLNGSGQQDNPLVARTRAALR